MFETKSPHNKALAQPTTAVHYGCLGVGFLSAQLPTLHHALGLQRDLHQNLRYCKDGELRRGMILIFLNVFHFAYHQVDDDVRDSASYRTVLHEGLREQ